MHSICYLEDVDFPRFKYIRLEILSNEKFNDTCLLLSFFFSYLKGCLLKTKLNIVARLIKCKIIKKEVRITKSLLWIIASI